MRREDFAGAYGECMYLLFMAIRPEALPTDAAVLTEMVLALDAENEKLRVAMQTLKDMIFGKRSERFVAIVAEQFALELDDLATGVTPPAPANQQFSFCLLGRFGMRQFDSALSGFLGPATVIQAAGGDVGRVDSHAARDVCLSAGEAQGGQRAIRHGRLRHGGFLELLHAMPIISSPSTSP